MSDLQFPGLNVSRETQERFAIYAALLEKWNPKINLVAKSTMPDAWDRHFVDSAQIFNLARPEERLWADFGSGGGFPGLVAAILSAELAPERRHVLVESDQRKSVFLRTVAREVGIDVRVEAARIEALEPLGADLISARALAPVSQLLKFCERHLSPSGRALFLKGAAHVEEIEMARKNWHFNSVLKPSLTDSNAIILIIEGIARV